MIILDLTELLRRCLQADVSLSTCNEAYRAGLALDLKHALSWVIDVDGYELGAKSEDSSNEILTAYGLLTELIDRQFAPAQPIFIYQVPMASLRQLQMLAGAAYLMLDEMGS